MASALGATGNLLATATGPEFKLSEKTAAQIVAFITKEGPTPEDVEAFVSAIGQIALHDLTLARLSEEIIELKGRQVTVAEIKGTEGFANIFQACMAALQPVCNDNVRLFARLIHKIPPDKRINFFGHACSICNSQNFDKVVAEKVDLIEEMALSEGIEAMNLSNRLLWDTDKERAQLETANKIIAEAAATLSESIE